MIYDGYEKMKPEVPDMMKKVVCLALVIILCVACAAAEDFMRPG